MGILGRLFGRDHRVNNDDDIIVENTGDVTETDGGTAVSGFKGPRPQGGSVRVENTGDATAVGPGSTACSGIDYT